MQAKYGVTGLMLVGLIACKPTAQAVEEASASKEQSEVATAGASSMADAFRKGMPYAELRRGLTMAGWLPLRDAECWDKLGDQSAICNHLPEISQCDESGRCIMHFANLPEQRQAEVVTTGQYERGNAPGEEDSVKVERWSFSDLDSDIVTSTECPSLDFDAFLQRFASDNLVKQTFTSSLVKVAELRTDDEDGFYAEKEGFHLELVYVPAAEYSGFNLAFRDGSFHFVNAEGQVDPNPLELTVTDEGANKRLVRYQYGMSEGNSYAFAKDGKCWRLIEDPDPPTP